MLNDLQQQLKDLALSMTQEEYMDFITIPLVEANSEKLGKPTYHFEENVIKIIQQNSQSNTERILAYMNNDYDKYKQELEERLKQYLEKLKKIENIEFPLDKPKNRV